jgi:hypothetical protein
MNCNWFAAIIPHSNESRVHTVEIADTEGISHVYGTKLISISMKQKTIFNTGKDNGPTMSM